LFRKLSKNVNISKIQGALKGNIKMRKGKSQSEGTQEKCHFGKIVPRR
jgi:hypothetical protein